MFTKYEKCQNFSNYGLEYFVLLNRRNELFYYNIFNNIYVDEELKNIEIDRPSHGELVRRLASIFMYSFWSKCEYEMIITPWVGGDNVEEKIDVWDQIYPNLELIAAIVEQKLEL